MSHSRINLSHLESQPYNEIEEFPSELSQDKHKPIPKGLSLHQVFSKDTLESHESSLTLSLQQEELDSTSQSYWRKFLNWWSFIFNPSVSLTKKETEVNKIQPPQGINAIARQTINSIPILDEPDEMPSEVKDLNHSQISKDSILKNVLATNEIIEELKKLDEQSIEMSLLSKLGKDDVKISTEKKSIETEQGHDQDDLDDLHKEFADLFDITKRVRESQNLEIEELILRLSEKEGRIHFARRLAHFNSKVHSQIEQGRISNEKAELLRSQIGLFVGTVATAFHVLSAFSGGQATKVGAYCSGVGSVMQQGNNYNDNLTKSREENLSYHSQRSGSMTGDLSQSMQAEQGKQDSAMSRLESAIALSRRLAELILGSGS